MYKKFLTSSGTLNPNALKRATIDEINSIREASGVKTATVNTALYCIHNSVSCKLCETCQAELNIETFVEGWKSTKRFCSIKCKAEYKPESVSGEVFTNYPELLDKNGNPSSGKLAKHINAQTVQDLKEKTGLVTDDVNTLLYAAINKDFEPKACLGCSKVLTIHNFQIGYRQDQQYCSYVCKDASAAYQDKLRVDKLGVSRFTSEKYLESRIIPWFPEKVEEIKNEFGVRVLSSLEEYIENNKILRFECIECQHTFKSDITYTRSLFCKLCHPKSKQQTELSLFVKSLGFEIDVDTREIIKPKEIDIWIPKLNIGIEYDGFYHHRNKDDSKKYQMAETAGIRIIRVFEDEYLYKKEIVLSRIKNILGKSDRRIFARKCIIKELDSATSNEFMEKNHIQGNVGATVRLGLYSDGILVSCMTFSKPRYDRNSEWELIRFSNTLNTVVVGGASKLFKFFLDNYKPKSIVSYCDVRYGSGNLYTKLGFFETGRSQANYFYYKKGVRHSRVKFQKHKLKEVLPIFDENLSEYENMFKNGYIKIFDNGNKVFHWLKP